MVDTNILVYAALTSGGTCDQIVRGAVNGRIRLASAVAILVEYREVLSRPKFKFQPEGVAALLKLFGASDQVTPKQFEIRLPDVDDEIFLAAAMATPDQILVTGNTAHYPGGLCVPVQIVSPAQALELLALL